MRRHPVIPRLTASLLLGAFLTLLIAMPIASHAPAVNVAPLVRRVVSRGEVLHPVDQTPTLLYDTYSARIIWFHARDDPAAEQRESLPPWVALPSPVTREGEHGIDELYMIETFANGWPFRAMKGERLGWTQPSLSRIRYEPRGFLQWSGKLLWPATPIWPGILLDTLFWSALWAGGFTLLAHLKLRRRTRRGLCPACAYNRSGLAPAAPCPECGHCPTPPPRS